MQRRRLAMFLLVAAWVLVACGGDKEQSLGPVTDPVDANQGPPVELESPVQVAPEPTPVPLATNVPEPTALPAPEPTAVAVQQAPAEPEIEPVIFNDDFATSIAPVFATACASCHNSGGPGATHWQLETAVDLVETHEWIAGVVSTGVMPPWPASDLSLDFHDNRSLRSDQIDAIVAWSAAGAPLDVADTEPITAPSGVISLDADVEIGPHEPYQGSTAVADDYRCLIYELDLDAPAWMSGFEFVPDQTQIVHHAIGYLAPPSLRSRAQDLSDADDLGGWQCYGGSGLGSGDDLFLGWAPGQLPTVFPEGAGLRAEPGDFIVLQVHYHFDSDAPADASTLRIDWSAETDLDPIDFAEFIGPAEIPCSADESGRLCDRDIALAAAVDRYGIGGVQAPTINQLCGVTPEDFASMTTGIANSSCTIPVRDFGEIVSVFGHEHEIGSSIRMTLNAGQPDERILLDIPDWSFDWQFNYYPTESIILEPGDSVLLECEWDRSRRSPSLEPAYVLWADGTNDEMCFATISTIRRSFDSVQESGPGSIAIEIPEELAACMRGAGVSVDAIPDRDVIDATVDQLFVCADSAVIGDNLTSLIADNFGGFVGDTGLACLSKELSQPERARELLIFVQVDSTEAERLPVGELVGDCVTLSEVLTEFGFPLAPIARECVNEAGRPLIVEATVKQDLPEELAIFAAINPCLGG